MTIDQRDPDSRLPDDLDSIASSLPRIARGYATLRQLIALLPNPLAATTQPSLPVDEMARPESVTEQMGAGAIGNQPGTTLMDGAVTQRSLADGAVTGAAFASTIRPVILVHGLPVLPDPAYPVDTFVYDIDAVPKSLWKNEAGVWVRAIGPADIQANSITAGQIAAGAISTSELAVGARLTGEVANDVGATPGVFIDSTGILVRDGQLTLQDEFGQTAMEASGFAGTWEDFIKSGLYNSAFEAGISTTLDLGRTNELPYWTVARDNVGSGTPDFANDGGAFLVRSSAAAMPAGFKVRMTFSGVNDNGYLISDPVRVTVGQVYFVRYTAAFNRTAGSVGISILLRWLDKNGVQIGAITGPGTEVKSVTTAADEYVAGHQFYSETSALAPANARSVQVIVQGFEMTTHNAANSVDIGSVALGLAVGDGEVDPNASISVRNLLVSGESTIDGPITMGITAERLWLSPPVFLKSGSATTPLSPTTGDQYYHTGVGMWFFYNGTRWLCSCLHVLPLGAFNAIVPISASQSQLAAVGVPSPSGADDFWIETMDTRYFVAGGGTALGASHKWVGTLTKIEDGTNTPTVVDTVSIASGASAVWRQSVVVVDQLLQSGTTYAAFTIDWAKTGTPGTLRPLTQVRYRYVAT